MTRPLSYAHERVARPAWRWLTPGYARRVPRVRRFLDPLERFSEVMFGLVMVLAYTASVSVATGGREEIRTILLGAIGCNLAWGLIDAAMYLLGTFTERARGLTVLRRVRRSRHPKDAHALIAEVIPPALATMLTEDEFEMLRRRMAGRVEPPTALRGDDYMAALGVFLLVFLSTFPVVLPFVVMRDARTALRVSQALAIAMLFVTGRAVGRHAGRPGWRTGLTAVVVGVIFAVVTYALGG